MMYKSELIANRQSVYSPGENIEIHIPAMNSIVNVAKSRYAHRPVYISETAAKLFFMNNPKACYQVMSIRADGRDMIAV